MRRNEGVGGHGGGRKSEEWPWPSGQAPLNFEERTLSSTKPSRLCWRGEREKGVDEYRFTLEERARGKESFDEALEALKRLDKGLKEGKVVVFLFLDWRGSSRSS
jgi:hypothetical protein